MDGGRHLGLRIQSGGHLRGCACGAGPGISLGSVSVCSSGWGLGAGEHKPAVGGTSRDIGHGPECVSIPVPAQGSISASCNIQWEPSRDACGPQAYSQAQFHAVGGPSTWSPHTGSCPPSSLEHFGGPPASGPPGGLIPQADAWPNFS